MFLPLLRYSCWFIPNSYNAALPPFLSAIQTIATILRWEIVKEALLVQFREWGLVASILLLDLSS